MDRQTLQKILTEAGKLRVLVVGDFFVDEYLEIDPARDEKSIETGLTAYQVVKRRIAPGAAGTVVNNLLALGVRDIRCLSVIGDDGRGMELCRYLAGKGLDNSLFIADRERVTPTYTKPVRRRDGRIEELNRLDLKNWSRLPADLETEVIDRLQAAAPNVDAIVVADQVEEKDCGVITSQVRRALAEIGASASSPLILVDSRANVGEFRQVIVKPNLQEATLALGLSAMPPGQIAREMAKRTGKPVFVTCAEQGIVVFDGVESLVSPAVTPDGPIDVTGAGDSTMAGICLALGAGTGWKEAAEMGNLVASITIRQLGTTGTASPQDVLNQHWQHCDIFQKK